MSLTPGQYYLVHLTEFPSAINQDTPDKGHPPVDTSEFPAVTVNLINSDNALLKRKEFRVCLLIEYQEEINIGLFLVGTSMPISQQHRFVPNGVDSIRLQGQPENVYPIPQDSFKFHKGYLNFTHPLRTRVSFDPAVRGVTSASPGFSLVRTKNLPVINLNKFSLNYIQQLHLAYWEGAGFDVEKVYNKEFGSDNGGNDKAKDNGGSNKNFSESRSVRKLRGESTRMQAFQDKESRGWTEAVDPSFPSLVAESIEAYRKECAPFAADVFELCFDSDRSWSAELEVCTDSEIIDFLFENEDSMVH